MSDKVIEQLRQAAVRREEMAQAHSRKAREFHQEAKEIRKVAREIERSIGPTDEDAE